VGICGASCGVGGCSSVKSGLAETLRSSRVLDLSQGDFFLKFGGGAGRAAGWGEKGWGGGAVCKGVAGAKGGACVCSVFPFAMRKPTASRKQRKNKQRTGDA
jgi:hypothetical protein